MPDLVVRIKKKHDGSAAFACERPDGSMTWQRQEGIHGRFFPLHDLTHYAVETELGIRRGFFGLVAEGWNVTDFGAPWPRGPVPPEAGDVELIVGFLDGERASGAQWSAADFNEKATTFFLQRGKACSLSLTDDDLRRIRDAQARLFAQWSTLPAGETMELAFNRSPAAA